MQTTYYKTSNYIRHEGNVVNLSAYRNWPDAVSGGPWTPGAEPTEAPWEASAAALYVVAQSRPAAKRRKKRQGSDLRFWLDVCASMSVLLLTMTAVLQFLRFF